MNPFGSAVKHNTYPIIKAECKNERFRVTITLNAIEGYKKDSKGYGGSLDKTATTETILVPDLYKTIKP